MLLPITNSMHDPSAHMPLNAHSSQLAGSKYLFGFVLLLGHDSILFGLLLVAAGISGRDNLAPQMSAGAPDQCPEFI